MCYTQLLWCMSIYQQNRIEPRNSPEQQKLNWGREVGVREKGKNLIAKTS